MNMLQIATAATAVTLLLSPGFSFARASAPAQADDRAVRQAKALELAQLVEPRESVDGGGKLEAQYVKGLLALQEVAELEAEHPGIVKAMWRAIAPEIERDFKTQLPEHWAKLADIYSSGMTLQQIDHAVGFMGGPTGRKMVRLMNEGLAAPSIGLAAEAAGSDISASGFAKAKVEAAETMARGLTEDEQKQVVAFGASPAGKALLSLGPQVQQASLEWMNKSDPETDARLEALMTKAIENFVAADGRKVKAKR